MGVQLKVCADCGRERMIGRSKRRCKECRKADPAKQIPILLIKKKSVKKKKLPARQINGIFQNWLISSLPKCIHSVNDYSLVGLGKQQRNFVLQFYGFKNYTEYLRSDLWFSIRSRFLGKTSLCVCGCRQQANQVHHKTYTEANLLGKTLRGLVAINKDCHFNIEFADDRKLNLSEANHELKQRKNINNGSYQ